MVLDGIKLVFVGVMLVLVGWWLPFFCSTFLAAG